MHVDRGSSLQLEIQLQWGGGNNEREYLIEWVLARISALQAMSRETINILDREGSSGNSTICLPRGVREPVLSRAPVIHSWYMEFRILSYSNHEFIYHVMPQLEQEKRYFCRIRYVDYLNISHVIVE